jgi:hypothetical protein
MRKNITELAMSADKFCEKNPISQYYDLTAEQVIDAEQEIRNGNRTLVYQLFQIGYMQGVKKERKRYNWECKNLTSPEDVDKFAKRIAMLAPVQKRYVGIIIDDIIKENEERYN